jgi:hypothetical protein
MAIDNATDTLEKHTCLLPVKQSAKFTMIRVRFC